MSRCDCKSYNRPDWGGTEDEVEAFSPQTGKVLIDSCIMYCMAMLWAEGVMTLGSCCGHNQAPASVVLGEHEDPERARGILAHHSARKWVIKQWQLVECE